MSATKPGSKVSSRNFTKEVEIINFNSMNNIYNANLLNFDRK